MTYMQPIVGPNDYVITAGGMKSGRGEAETRRYHKYECPRGVWLVAAQPNAADNVYFHCPSDTKSDGFGGSTLVFPLVGGGEYVAKGPWHGNSDSLFRDTGVDVRDKCLTFVVLAKGYDWNYGRTIMRDVVYRDPDWTLGTFYRYRDLILEYPDATHYYSGSQGGSSCGPIGADDRVAAQRKPEDAA